MQTGYDAVSQATGLSREWIKKRMYQMGYGDPREQHCDHVLHSMLVVYNSWRHMRLYSTGPHKMQRIAGGCA